MGAIFSHHPWTVQDLVGGVASGTVRLPDIQRPFVWSNAKVRDLVDSMYRGYPVGELMFWANVDQDHSKAIGADEKSQLATMQVIDGQQRLTSLYAVVKGLKVWREDYTQDVIRIAFNPLTERFEVPTVFTERSAEWIDDIVSVFAAPIEARSSYLDGLADDREVDRATAVRVEVAINKLAGLQQYTFQVVQVKQDIAREEVADIFVRINSEGVNLSSADFILTWMSVFWEPGRSQLEEFARNSRFTPEGISQLTGRKVRWTPHNPFLTLDAAQLVRVVVAVGLHRGRLSDAYNRLRGRDPRTREIDPQQRDAELARLRAGQEHVLNPVHWDEFLRVLERAGFRSREMITSKNTVLYSYALWLIGRVEFGVPVGQLREVMARWFFVSQITGRYTNSPESQIQEDINRLDGLTRDAVSFTATLAALTDAAVPADWWQVTLPEALYTSSVTTPAWVGYVAALNILDADVLLSTMKVKDWISPTRRSAKGVEKHHLFPRDYLASALGVASTRKINQVANYALVEWSDNIAISNQPPHDYWPLQLAGKGIDPARRTRQEQWHALPPGWESMDYDEFLAVRRRLLAKVTHEAFKRLGDPAYRPDLSMPAMEPSAAEHPLPTLEDLVAAGVLPVGTILTATDLDAHAAGEITEDGALRVRDHVYDSLTRAAREQGADIDSGWDYWVAQVQPEPVLMADLRQRAAAGSSGTA